MDYPLYFRNALTKSCCGINGSIFISSGARYGSPCFRITVRRVASMIFAGSTPLGQRAMHVKQERHFQSDADCNKGAVLFSCKSATNWCGNISMLSAAGQDAEHLPHFIQRAGFVPLSASKSSLMPFHPFQVICPTPRQVIP